MNELNYLPNSILVNMTTWWNIDQRTLVNQFCGFLSLVWNTSLCIYEKIDVAPWRIRKTTWMWSSLYLRPTLLVEKLNHVYIPSSSRFQVVTPFQDIFSLLLLTIYGPEAKFVKHYSRSELEIAGAWREMWLISFQSITLTLGFQ